VRHEALCLLAAESAAQGAAQRLRVTVRFHLGAWWADECGRLQKATGALGCKG